MAQGSGLRSAALSGGGGESPESSRWTLLGLVAIILIFVILGSVVAIKTPAYESGDEPGHVQNIETLVSGHWYGMSSDCRITDPHIDLLLNCSGDEAQQAPLYYLLLAGWQRVAGLPAHAPFKGELNPAIYFRPTELFVHHNASDHRFLLWLRLPNVLLGALTVIVTFFAVRLMTSDAWTPVVAAALVAFLPRFVFVSSFVTNDNLVDLLGAVLVLLVLRFANAPSRWHMAMTGAVLGLLVTTKLTTLPLVIVLVPLACLVAGWKRRAELFGVGIASALVVSGWYLIQNTVRYGDPLAREATARYLTKIGGLGILHGVPYVVSNPLKLTFIQVPQRIVQSFWYESGWGQFHWSWPVNLAITVVFVCILTGLVHGRARREVLVPLIAISVTALLTVLVGAFETSTYNGRYALVGLAAIAALTALGLERWKLPVRFLVPTMALCGTLIAIQQNVLGVHWS